MTKTVRIENADAGMSYVVKVQKQTKNDAGEWADSGSPTILTLPAALISLTLTDRLRYIVEDQPS